MRPLWVYACRFNWGLAVRKKSEQILKLLEEGTLLKEERNRARRLSRGIQGFGSFGQHSTQSHRMQTSITMKIRKTNPLAQTIVWTQQQLNLLVQALKVEFSSPWMIVQKLRATSMIRETFKCTRNLKQALEKTWHLARRNSIYGTWKGSLIHFWMVAKRMILDLGCS